MDHLPVILDLQAVRCLVVGGGKIAERRVNSFLQGGADVTVISPHLHSSMQTYAEEGKLLWLKRCFQDGDVRSYQLVVAATDNAVVNTAVAVEARGQGTFVHVASQPELGNLHTPAVMSQGALTLAVSTGGGSPVLARLLRDHLSQNLPAHLSDLIALLQQIRASILAGDRSFEQKQRILHSLVSEELLQHYLQGLTEPLNLHLMNLVAQYKIDGDFTFLGHSLL